MQDLLEDIQDQEADMQEVSDMFANKANENMDDAYDELEEMMKEENEKEAME